MSQEFRVPPESKSRLTPLNILLKRLRVLIGEPFPLTGKTRTDGSNLRKLIWSTLQRFPLPPPCSAQSYRIVPPRKKGLPRLMREWMDTYIVPTGDSYNLQVWNRNPTAMSVQIEYASGETLLANEARFVFVKVDSQSQQIRSIIISTPEYIEKKFTRFGKPTIKHQLIIAPSSRVKVLKNRPPILFHDDLDSVSRLTRKQVTVPKRSIQGEPSDASLLSLRTIRDLVAAQIIGKEIPQSATKNRGQVLEEIVARMLGYTPSEGELLAGGYPDIRHQALEVKVQDAPTVDLGKFSPQFEEDVPGCPGFTTASVRYLIALTDEATGVARGAVICPGSKLGEHFTYVSDASFKCQRSIPMEFFDKFAGRVVVNP